ncbi:hypothetical protein [Hydrogenophaga sp. 5NK40-0174]|uniref:hypothetical protein n=1 Tax=Hydrogenophaga sp. 5NK40-0174 TaxID=3127649 RepID=UPI00310B9A1C
MSEDHRPSPFALNALKAIDADKYATPEWSNAAAIDMALLRLSEVHDANSAMEAYDQFLWTVGDNHKGTFYPVVLSTLPALQYLLTQGEPWTQQAVLESLIDLAGTFAPEAGHEWHMEQAVQARVRESVIAMRPAIEGLTLSTVDGAAPSEGEEARVASAAELLELIDDLGT